MEPTNRHAKLAGWLADPANGAPAGAPAAGAPASDSPAPVGPAPADDADDAPQPLAELPAFAVRWAIFLDIDGTLLDFADHPHAVLVEPALVGLLARLRDATGGALALISGRSIADVQSLFAPLTFAVAGQHGIERRSLGGVAGAAVPPGGAIEAAAAELTSIAARHDGMLIENKGSTLALHYRRNPRLARSARHAAHVIARRLGAQFEVQAGKHVIEVKPSGRNKGSAIADFLSEPPFAGRVPVFIGDDSTDEFGFAVVNRLGGHSIKVGDGPSRARWRLRDATAVRSWLEHYVDWLERARREAAP